MCLANIYQSGIGGELITKEIAYLKVDGNKIEMENLTGESKKLRAKINEIDFMNSDVFCALSNIFLKTFGFIPFITYDSLKVSPKLAVGYFSASLMPFCFK